MINKNVNPPRISKWILTKLSAYENKYSIIDDFEEVGIKRIIWDGKDLYGRTVASGVYTYRLQMDNQIRSRRMIIQK